MKKTLITSTAFCILFSSASTVISCDHSDNGKIILAVPEWVKHFQGTNLQMGYQDRVLPASHSSWDRHCWLNLTDEQKELFLYLPHANTIDQAVTMVHIQDTADLMGQGITPDPITWKKIDNQTYTNNSFITEDTAVGGIATIGDQKADEILKSSFMRSNSIPQEAINYFKEYNAMKADFQIKEGQYIKDWWNSNHWEALLHTDVQKNNYKAWVNPATQVGMNVPLSYISSNSIIMQATEVPHVFAVNIDLESNWIDNKANLITNQVTPHWGLFFKIQDGETNILTPQLVTNINHTHNWTAMQKYLEKNTEAGFDKMGNTLPLI